LQPAHEHGFIPHRWRGNAVKNRAAHPKSLQFLYRLSSLFPITVVILFLPQTAKAAEWSLKLSLSLSESYSDNIAMSSPPNKRPDWATDVSPGLILTANGSRLKLQAHYQMQNVFYAHNGQHNATNHHLKADAHSELVEEHLFLDGIANVSQQNISASGNQSLNNFNISANRADVTSLIISPYLKNHFQGLADSEIRFTHSILSTNALGFANDQNNKLMLKLDTGHAFGVMKGGLSYTVQQSNYSNFVPTINGENYTGNLSYMLTPRFALNANAGYETSDYLSIGRQPRGVFYSAGITWVPSQRTHIEASAGHRFYGSTFAIAAKHRSRRTTWQLDYSEDVTTTQAQFLADAGLPNQPVPGPGNFFSNRVFLQKRWQGSVTVTGRRNTVVFNLFDVWRDAQTPQAQNLALLGAANLALSDQSKQLGSNTSWNSKITPQTTATLTAGYSRNILPTVGITSYDSNIQLSVATRLETGVSSAIRLLHNQRSSNQPNGNYQENAITAALLMQF